MQIEHEITNEATTNRHLAEERNQIGLNAEQDDDVNADEEAKYGATTLKGETRVTGQDGGVFSSVNKDSGKPSNSPKAGGKGKAKPNRGKKTTTQAPAGKFKTFHAKQGFNPNGLKDMTNAGCRDLGQTKEPFFAPTNTNQRQPYV